jgi:hypothetical protein
MRLVSLVCVVLVLGCGDAVAPGLAPLVGEWRSSLEPLQPQGSMEKRFVVWANGRSENWTTTRGLYGQGAGDLSAEVVLYGRITVRGDKFVIHPDSEVTRDVFYGPSYRAVRTDFSAWPSDSTRFEIRDDALHLEYYSYPADAPVLTQRVLYRVSGSR